MASRYPVSWARNYDAVQDDAYDDKLEEIVDKMAATKLLAIPGVYELLSAKLDSAVLAALAGKK